MFKNKRLDEETILNALRGVDDPQSGLDIVDAAMVKGLQIAKDGSVLFMVEVDAARGAAMEPLRQAAEDVVRGVKGVSKVTAILTAEKSAEPEGAAKASGASGAKVSDPHGMEKNPKLNLPIKKIIAVASGKGGVGKSTVAAAIARAMAADGTKRVGLLDADIYGPSQPTLFGLKNFKPSFTEAKTIIPANVDGLKIMSIGFMVDAQKALVWRGPMVQSAIYQMFRDVQWAENDDEPLDVLIVDMPPGTGDAQLTLAQKIAVDGAIIVSTPQDLALADARKGVEMFRAVNVPILGLIENMSTHICTNCGHEEHIFGHGGAKDEAERLGIPFLGEIPLSADIRAKADAGEGFEIPSEILSAITLSDPT